MRAFNAVVLICLLQGESEHNCLLELHTRFLRLPLSAFSALDSSFRPAVDQGRPNAAQNMKSEMITEEELLGQLRQQGVDDVSKVKKCYLEGDGRISVIKTKGRG